MQHDAFAQATHVLKLESELRSTLAKMQVALDAIAEAIVWTDKDGKLQWGNRAFGRLIGRMLIEVLGRHVADLLPLERAGKPVPRRDHPVTLAIQGQVCSEMCFELPRSDNNRVLEVSAARTLVSEHEISAVLVIRDVTEHKQAEKDLQGSQALYHSLVESIPLQVFRKDRESRFTFANERFCESLGLPLEQIVGKTDLDFYPEHLAAKYQRDDRRVLETGEIFQDVEQHQRPDGERLYVAVVKTPVFDADKRIVGTQCMFWDVTVNRWAEEQKAQLHLARLTQQNLLPKPPEVAHFDIGGACLPAEATGGDYFDYIPLRDGSIGIIIAEVSGHGFGPALLAAVTHACLRTLALTQADIDIAAMLSTANRLLYGDTTDEQFVTLVLVRLDPQARCMYYSSAGHPTGYILNAAGEVKTRLASTSAPLGLGPAGAFPVAAPIALAPGDLVLLISDGVRESMSPDKALFGDDRTLDVVRAHRQHGAQAIADVLCHTARAFRGTAPQSDDITAVVIRLPSDSQECVVRGDLGRR
jgi:sigma-B regulation protein RsbU (phosphoserine phosphatase)